MHILATYGDLRSGKDYIAEELTRRLKGFVSYPTSMPIRRFVDALNANLTNVTSEDEKDSLRTHLGEVSKAGHEAFGPDIWIDLSLKDLESQHKTGVIFTGNRIVGEVDAVHDRGGLNIWVEASRETINQRYLSKGIELTDEVFNNFWDTQIRPYKHDKSKIDLIIRNDGNAQETEEDLRAALEVIKKHFGFTS